ncbi:hypothetical protein L6R52_35650 [Myxococcota bacterium]|nr:hypothetical protein [Myxococcota bacterium]
MWRTTEGSSGRLLQLCGAYFFFYVVTGVGVKYFQGPAASGFPGMGEIEFLAYSTLGGTAICLAVVLARKWYRFPSPRHVKVAGLSIPHEYLYIIPSGVCTAVVIPTTTLLYSIEGISVMVAMVIMRGAVIVISRAVDAVQIRQGILKKRLYVEENIAVVFALGAVSVILFWEKAGFDFLGSVAAVTILVSYLVAYSLRIYIMNYYKNTRPPGEKLNNEGFFAIEQISASVVMALLTVLLFFVVDTSGSSLKQLVSLHAAIAEPHAMWSWAVLAGTAYGMVAFFSVFIFMFKGRSATFAGLVNRLTSLVAGTTATLVSFLFFGGKLPGPKDWASLALILIAVAFLTIAERKRAADAASAHATALAKKTAAPQTAVA